MARGRIINKEIYVHEKLNELSVTARYFYQGLIVFADDEGRIKAHPAYLKAKIFPADNIKNFEIKKMVDQLATIGCLVVYEVNGSRYLEHPHWTRWQSVRKDRFHPSDCPSPREGKPMVNHLATNGKPSGNRNLTQPNLSRGRETETVKGGRRGEVYPPVLDSRVVV